MPDRAFRTIRPASRVSLFRIAKRGCASAAVSTAVSPALGAFLLHQGARVITEVRLKVPGCATSVSAYSARGVGPLQQTTRMPMRTQPLSRARSMLALIACCVLAVQTTRAATLPAGFSETLV